MNQSDIEKYLNALEIELVFESERRQIILNRTRTDSFPYESAVYLFKERDKICYIGETGTLKVELIIF